MILLAVLLLVAGGIMIGQALLKKPGAFAVVQVDGVEVARLDLAKDTALVIGGEKQDYNIVEIKDGCASVTEADCADHICVRTGKICNQGEVIACLPHKLIVSIERKDGKGQGQSMELRADF